jgi:hypothetical protein
MDETRQFLQSLFASKTDESQVLIWQHPQKISRWFRDLEQAAKFAEEHASSDLYVGVGLSPEDYGPNRRCAADNVCGLPALWIDFDVAGPAHQKTNLPATAEDALSILPPELPPSLVVHSGHGLHAWWIFREIELIEDDDDRTRAKEVIKRWERYIRARAQGRGWTIDATHDLARILRIPGTTNNKITSHPVKAHIYAQNEIRYNLSDFEEHLSDLPLLDANPIKVSREIAAPDVQPGRLIISATRSLDPHKLRLFLRDVLFYQTWHHQRIGFTDASQSSYDLAIGNMLFEAGCTDQEIVDGLIQNRRDSGVQSKLRLDYYGRTLRAIHSKRRSPGAESTPASVPVAPALPASEQIRQGDIGAVVETPASAAPPPTAPPAPPVDAAIQPAAPPPEDETPAQAAMRKAGLCEALSHTLGLTVNGQPNITRIVKVDGEKPTWRIELKDGRIIPFTSHPQLREYGRFAGQVFTAINKEMDKVFKPAEWKAVVQCITQAMHVVKPGEENTATGKCRAMLEWYLLEIGLRASAAEAFVDAKDAFGPFVDEGRIAIHQMALQSWVSKTRDIKMEPSEMAASLSAIGATAREFKVGPLRQSRWILPEKYKPENFRMAEQRGRLGVAEEDIVP